MGKKICKDCNKTKPITEFYFRNDNMSYRLECKDCFKQKEYAKRESPEYKLEKKEYNKEYRRKNHKKLKIKDKEKNKKYLKDGRNRLRRNVSRSVHRTLVSRNKSKDGRRIFDYLDYTEDDLKTYIEKLFTHPDNLINGSPWMSWDNYGKYNAKTWDDNDPSTWKWELDHIIPHSIFNYNSIEHPDFKKCWALENLRPYSAKQNMVDGARRSLFKRNK